MSALDFNRKVTRADIWPILLGIVLGIVICITIYAQHLPTGEFICAFIVSYGIAVIFHEIGHAIAVLTVGGTVDFVRVGQSGGGRTPWTLQLFGFSWAIYGLPFSGGVHHTIEAPDHYRTRRCIIATSGPASNALLLAIGVAGLFIVPSTQLELLLFIVGWVFANGYMCLYNLSPRMVRSCGKIVPNDGLTIVQTIRQSDEDIRRLMASFALAKEMKLIDAKAPTLSTDELLTKHQAAPENIAYLWHLTERFRVGADPRYPEHVLKLIALPQLPEHVVLDLMDTCLTWQLHLGPPENPAFTDELSQRLLARDNNVSTRGTRGSVLINIGRIAEGKALLQEVLDQTKATVDKSYSLIFLALAHEAEGNLNDARAHALVAKEIDPDNAALKRIAHLVKPSSQR